MVGRFDWPGIIVHREGNYRAHRHWTEAYYEMRWLIHRPVNKSFPSLEIQLYAIIGD